ncbi:MAG: hypothetical protein AAGE96_01275 [Cyanobacteria bacterium P01_G01_bin.19]
MWNLAIRKEIIEKKRSSKLGIETVLSLVAIALIVSIFFKAILDLDTNYDPGWYHLPFAARLGGILPKEMFMGDEKWFEPRFDGFPLLAHFLQGIFWRITGRIQSTNLVSFFSIIAYFCFLKSYLQVPLYLSAIALFSIPLVLTHATTSFVDLFGNVGTSMLVMMTYSFYKNKSLPNAKELIVAFVGAAIAANTKTQLQPLVFVILIVAVARLAWLYWRQKPVIGLSKIIPVAILASAIIFATPVKNTILYQNPLYPIKIEVAGIVLNHKLSPEAYEEGNRQINWLKSVLEINSPLFWTPDQWSGDPDRSRKGGFWGAYVVFNFLLLVCFAIRENIINRQNKNSPNREAKVALLTAIAMSIVPLNFPQSHELRYFMYWMICLVSLNLYLISLPKNRQLIGRWLQPKYVGLIYAIFLSIILVKVGKFYAQPSFITLDKYVAFGVKLEFINQIQPEEEVCLLSRHIGENVQAEPITALKYAFVYSSYFHPEIEYDYSVRAALKPEACGERTIIPATLPSE